MKIRTAGEWREGLLHLPMDIPSLWVCPVCDWTGDLPYIAEDDEPYCPKCGALLEVD